MIRVLTLFFALALSWPFNVPELVGSVVGVADGDTIIALGDSK